MTEEAVEMITTGGTIVEFKEDGIKEAVAAAVITIVEVEAVEDINYTLVCYSF